MIRCVGYRCRPGADWPALRSRHPLPTGAHPVAPTAVSSMPGYERSCFPLLTAQEGGSSPVANCAAARRSSGVQSPSGLNSPCRISTGSRSFRRSSRTRSSPIVGSSSGPFGVEGSATPPGGGRDGSAQCYRGAPRRPCRLPLTRRRSTLSRASGRCGDDRVQCGSSRSLPVVRRPCRSRWARPASASGYRPPMVIRSDPPAIASKTSPARQVSSSRVAT